MSVPRRHQQRERSVDAMLVRGGGVVHASRDGGQRSLVQDHVNTLHGRTGYLRIAHVGLDEVDLIQDRRQVAPLARQQVVHHPDKASLIDQASADIGADETSPPSYQILFHPGPRDLRLMMYHLQF